MQTMELSLNSSSSKEEKLLALDEKLSRRFIHLDPKGYFLIRVDSIKCEIVVEHFTNDLDDKGRAIDPETGEVIGCKGGTIRSPSKVYKGLSAKELGILLTEGDSPYPLSRIEHAMYLGRELQKAEGCLISGKPYVQD